jgi:tyrosine phenol-lyase
LEALSVGIEEAMQEDYLEYRAASVRTLAYGLERTGLPTLRPPGGHAVFIDAKAMLPHLPASQFPGQALAAALYVEGGIRSCEIGSVMFGRDHGTPNFEPAPMELVRLALPRRCYTQSHVERVVEIAADLARRKDAIRGLRITHRPNRLPHFTARFEPL